MMRREHVAAAALRPGDHVVIGPLRGTVGRTTHTVARGRIRVALTVNNVHGRRIDRVKLSGMTTVERDSQ